jgi:tetratricopeptide (TPR) repeat protein
MELNPSVGLNRYSVTHADSSSSDTALSERLSQLTAWMMVLATIRLVCALGDGAAAILELTRGEPFSSRVLARFFHENHPIVFVSAAWPLLLAICLRRTRWSELVKAAGVTFLVLGIGSVMALTAELNRTYVSSITVGSFHLPTRVLAHPTLGGAMLAMIGTAQIILELRTAVCALFLAGRLRGSPVATQDRAGASRRARIGRLAIYTSLAYLFVMLRIPLWSAYLEVLNQSTLVREFVLQNDFQRIHGPRAAPRGFPGGQKWMQMQGFTNSGMEAWNARQYEAARDSYLQAIALADSVAEESHQPSLYTSLSTSLNNLAWLMATCPDQSLRDPAGAVKYARRAVELSPSNGNWWNTLGVAYYRAGQWNEARTAFFRSMELRNQGDSYDWFFLGLVELKLGRADLARQHHDKAVRWVRRLEAENPEVYLFHADELYRFEVEAAEELGLPKPRAPTVKAPAVRPPIRREFALPPRRMRARLEIPSAARNDDKSAPNPENTVGSESATAAPGRTSG